MFPLTTTSRRNAEEDPRSSTTSLNMSSLLKPSSAHLQDDNKFDGSSVTQELSFLSDDMDSSSNSSNADIIELCPNSVLLSDYEVDSLADLSVESSSSPTSQQQQQSPTSSSGAQRTGGLRRASSGGSSSTSTSNSSARSVRFADAHIRKYAVCVGDNPAVSLGVPVSLDWQVVSEETRPVVDALHLEGSFHHHLTEEELRLPSQEREAMVRNAGFSTEEIRTSVRAVNLVKMEREKTLDTLKNQKGEYRMEKLRKGVWNATVRRRTKKMERAWLQELLKQDQQRILEVAQ